MGEGGEVSMRQLIIPRCLIEAAVVVQVILLEVDKRKELT